MFMSIAAIGGGLTLTAPAAAWGFEGHEIIAAIARAELTPTVRAKVDAILATDRDTLTQPDMLSRATWADAWRAAGHRETASWHFVDDELASPGIDAACFGHPAPAVPPSAGPAQDCVVDKIDEFRAELAAPTTTPAERLLALKYLLHFVGDVHQPLHAADNQDRGGNCILVSLGGSQTTNLHAYWDTTIIQALGSDPQAIGLAIRAKITAKQRKAWRSGDATAWAEDSFAVARAVAYSLNSPAGCASNPAAVVPPPAYAAKAGAAASLQLQKAGVRLALVLKQALARVRARDVGLRSDDGSAGPNK